MLADGGYIIYEHGGNAYGLPEGMRIAKRKKFGIVTVDFIGKSRGKLRPYNARTSRGA